MAHINNLCLESHLQKLPIYGICYRTVDRTLILNLGRKPLLIGLKLQDWCSKSSPIESTVARLLSDPWEQIHLLETQKVFNVCH